MNLYLAIILMMICAAVAFLAGMTTIILLIVIAIKLRSHALADAHKNRFVAFISGHILRPERNRLLIACAVTIISFGIYIWSAMSLTLVY